LWTLIDADGKVSPGPWGSAEVLSRGRLSKISRHDKIIDGAARRMG